MHIKTIYYEASGFYTSALKWNDPPYAFKHRNERTGRPLIADDQWKWIGSPGWYGTDENKALFDRIDKLVGLDGWHEGEFQEVDLFID